MKQYPKNFVMSKSTTQSWPFLRILLCGPHARPVHCAPVGIRSYAR